MDKTKEYGNYDAPWTKTFDLAFLIGCIAALIGLVAWSVFDLDKSDIDRDFFAFCLVKIIIVGIVSLVGGIICRKFCDVDEKGYHLCEEDCVQSELHAQVAAFRGVFGPADQPLRQTRRIASAPVGDLLRDADFSGYDQTSA